jgi:uncharacterized protein
MLGWLFRRRKMSGASPACDLTPPVETNAGKEKAVFMAGDGIHVPYEKLPRRVLEQHYANTSMREELEAVDWYRQRAADAADAELKSLLLHNAKEEIEHFAMLLEWTRRNDPEFDKELREYLFSEGPITEVEKKAMGRK